MIRTVRFKNFRCLQNLELTLEPLTVLVGPNSSGKTTVLEGLDRHELSGISDFWQQQDPEEAFIWRKYTDREDSLVRYLPGRVLEVSQGHSSQPLALDLKALRSENVLALDQRLKSAR
ncbi:AAA family ATPase [Archangium sp.]|uniref:AAA family ATPase n=1 Tax=Archangium sp. TaxID=1872627 RepID=UPI00286A7C59|nr:AAA family ATPase [Archangium sp.]